MPVPTTTDEIVDLMRRSGLIDPLRFDNVLNETNIAVSDVTPRELVNRLVAAGLVTQFQSEQFLLGKWRGFTIGKYKVLERLGFGGNGTVYLCEHLVVKRRVAIKVLPLAKAANPAALGRFYREAHASGVLNHPNLVTAHDIDQENGLHFLVMEFVDGTSLQDLVMHIGPLPVERAAHYIQQAAKGLQSAHEAGLVHRDIKPSNILLARCGTVKILDLGLARFYNDETDNLTLKYDDNAVLGTADYVSPEQAINSHGADIRADIYSLGCTLYFLLSARPPFPGGKAAQKLIAHQTKMPRPIRELRSDLPAELALVLETMLAKKPECRYQTPAEVIAALAPWTATPLLPPSETEMPYFSPAARGEGGDPTPSPHSPSVVVKNLSRSGETPNIPMRPGAAGSPSLGVVRKQISAADLATPRTLNAESPTDRELKKKLQATAAQPSGHSLQPPASYPMAKGTEAGAKRSPRRLVGILIASIFISVLARWSIAHWNEATAIAPVALHETLIVSSSGEEGTYATIAEALQHAHAGDRVIVQAETWEEAVHVGGDNGFGKDVQIEGRGPGDRPVLWRSPQGRDAGQPLLKIAGVSSIQVRGFSFDGQDQLRELIVLSGACPGVLLEDLNLTGFQQSGIALRNCSGTDQGPVTLQQLRIAPTRAATAALHFDSRGEEVNRAIRVLNCRLEGPYEAAVVLSGRTADIELAQNRIFDAGDGVLYRKAVPAYPVGLRLTSNTFYKIANVGLHFEAAPPAEGSRVELTRNLFGQTGRLAHVEGFVSEPQQTSAHWIWAPGPVEATPRYFRLVFQVEGPSVSRAMLDIAADAGFTAWLNGEPIGSGRLDRVHAFDVARWLRPGKNVLAVRATGKLPAAGLLACLTYSCAGSDEQVLASDGTWKVSAEEAFAWQRPGFDDAHWKPAVVVADYGQGESGWRNLVWDKVVRDTFGSNKAEQLFPEPGGNYRDSESAESFPLLKAPALKFSLPTDTSDDATFLRYAPGSEPALAGSPGATTTEKHSSVAH